MSIESVLARIATLEQALRPQPPAQSGGFAAPGQAATFSDSLDSAMNTTGLQLGVGSPAAAGGASMTGAGARALAFAQAELGVTEQPPGSNDAPRIADYRASTAGAGVGPWCAYFVSWAARQAGTPIGEAGQGFGSVAAVWDWAQRTGRTVPAGQPPQAGDIIVWGGTHIGFVESVAADGTITTIEGNSSNAVTRRTHDASGDGATGFVRL